MCLCSHKLLQQVKRMAPGILRATSLAPSIAARMSYLPSLQCALAVQGSRKPCTAELTCQHHMLTSTCSCMHCVPALTYMRAPSQDYQRLLSSTPSRRLNPAKLGESGVLKNKLVETISFLENLAVKDSAEKDMFFKRLPAAVPQLPLPVAQLKLLPMLAGSPGFRAHGSRLMTLLSAP